jgi:RNA polymerase sigma-70 factor, ECF subfamily
MPPHPEWFAGRDAVTTFLRATPLAQGTRWRALPIAANGQPSLAFYAWHDGAFTAHGVNVLSLRGEQIAELVTFLDPSLFARFELPNRL